MVSIELEESCELTAAASSCSEGLNKAKFFRLIPGVAVDQSDLIQDEEHKKARNPGCKFRCGKMVFELH